MKYLTFSCILVRSDLWKLCLSHWTEAVALGWVLSSTLLLYWYWIVRLC